MTREQLIEAMAASPEDRAALALLDCEEFASACFDHSYHRGFDDGVHHRAYRDQPYHERREHSR